MSTPSTTPYDWLKALPQGLINTDDVPLVGHAPPFPWQKFSEGIAKLFEIDKLQLNPGEWQWRDEPDLYTGISGKPHLLRFGLAGYEGVATLALDQHDFLATTYLLLLHRNLEAELLDPSHEEAFFYFLTLAACDQFTNSGWEKGLQIHLLPEGAASAAGPQLTLDIQVDFPQRSFPVRLLIDNTLRQNWKEKHLAPFDISRNPSLAKKIDLPVSIEAGFLEMSASDWQNIKEGDFIALDSCTIDSDCKEGTLLLRIHNLPFYRAQLSEGNVIIQEQPSYHE